ncbi:MAG TPA: cupredoxin domain-containing protein [Actinomycetota bacterium]|jgi:plastocyanin|nr:cupredoxin domain-containing protein [Actinomycetota bacterium]
MRTSSSLFAVVLVLALAATACGKDNGSEGGGETITIAGQKANDKGTKDVSGASSSELELNNEGNVYYFEPTILKGTAGQKITLELSNEGSALHNFSVTDQGIDQDVPSEMKAEVTVTFPQSGTLVFFCKYHQTKGMVGALEVA